MAAVSETIVREYFELHGFFVRQQRKFTAPGRTDEDDIDFLVVNPAPRPAGEPAPFILRSLDLAGLERAMVAVKGWHTEVFGPKLLAGTPELFRFVEPAAFQQALKTFGTDGTIKRLLVVPTLPADDQAREESIQFLREKGVDGVILFRTMLADLIERIESNRNYQKSDLLQIIRILKTYDFIREPQLELFRPKRKRATRKAPAPDALPQ